MQKKVDPIVLKIDSGSNSVKYCGHKNTSPVFLLWYTRIFFVSSFFTIYFSLKCPVSSKGTDVAHKILVIYDEEDFLQALTIRLEHAGYTTTAARDGEEAFECLHNEKPDLIILDVQMPKMDGLEFIRTLRKDANLKDIPVLFLTAGAFEIADEVSTLSTAQDFLLKSVDNEQIVERISKFL